jgi:translin
MSTVAIDNRLHEVGDALLGRLEATNRTRDRALSEGRQIIRLSANAVRAVHRGDLEDSRALLESAQSMLGALCDELESAPPLRWAGYVQDAMKEYAEAAMTLSIVANSPFPTPESLGIDDAPYLNALAESGSELRRAALDALRSGDYDEAERFLRTMDEIYAFLVTVDYPDALTGGLRRSTDALRAVLERTRGDLTITAAQNRLEQALERAMERID